MDFYDMTETELKEILIEESGYYSWSDLEEWSRMDLINELQNLK